MSQFDRLNRISDKLNSENNKNNYIGTINSKEFKI